MTLLTKKDVITNQNEVRQVSRLSNKVSRRSIWVSAAVISICIFICLNILPILFESGRERKQTNAPDQLRNKLRNFVHAYESEQRGSWPYWVARAYFSGLEPAFIVMGDSQINAALIQADAMALINLEIVPAIVIV